MVKRGKPGFIKTQFLPEVEAPTCGRAVGLRRGELGSERLWGTRVSVVSSAIMKQSTDYLQLASHFEAAAEPGPNQGERQNLRDLARIYFMLATTASTLQRSKEAPPIRSGRRN